jgi:hypothetical protein
LIQNFICKFVFGVISSIHVRFWKFQSLPLLEKWEEFKYVKKNLKGKVLWKKTWLCTKALMGKSHFATTKFSELFMVIHQSFFPLFEVASLILVPYPPHIVSFTSLDNLVI